MSCFRSFFFFNPFAQLFFKALARERELACDEGVLELGFAPELYAEALFSLEKFRQPQPGFSLAADGNKPWLLLERIRRVLGKPPGKINRANPLVYFSLLVAAVLPTLQPKQLIQERPVSFSTNTVTIIPVPYESGKEQKNIKDKESFVSPDTHRKYVKVKGIRGIVPRPDVRETAEIDPKDQTFFVDNNIVRDFSNQEAAELSQDPIQGAYGTPYVPSASLSYDARNVMIATDSIRDMVIQEGFKDIIRMCNMKTIAALKELEVEIEKNSRELNNLQIKNKQLFLQDQIKIKPLLRNFQKLMESKKKQIDRLRIQLQDSEEEIINI